MARPPVLRVLGVLALLGVLVGLLVWHGSLHPDPAVGAFPGAEELGADYAQYHGELVAVDGRVVATDPVTVRSDLGDGRDLRLRVVGLDGSGQSAEGDYLRVYGVVEPAGTIRAVNAITVPSWGRWYAWSVSFLAGLWVLGRIGRQWRPDRASWALERRDRTASARSSGRARGVSEADERA